MNIVTGPNIESEADLSRYLLSLQVEGVLSNEDMEYTRKCNRCGWSWTMALKAVRTRIMQTSRRDKLFTTQNLDGAMEYNLYLRLWIDVYNLSRFLLLSGHEENVTIMVPDGKGGKIAVQDKRTTWKFDNGSRIILFSSNPHSLQTFEGDVDWDEAEFHEQQEEMHTALSTRLMWGFQYHAWSACNGVDTWVNQVLWPQATAPNSGWKVRTITIYDAIASGIVERINAKSGSNMSREDFIALCRRRVITEEAFAQRFECIPSGSKGAIIDEETIKSRATQPIVRQHVNHAEIQDLFGPADEDEARRLKLMTAWMDSIFGAALNRPAHYRLGFDVAASGNGDLGAFWIDVKVGVCYRQVALLTTRTEDWHFIKSALFWFMRRPGMKGAGDATGIGRQITWEAAQAFSSNFIGVPFTSSNKARMGLRLMMQLQNGNRQIASGDSNADIGQDIYGLQKGTKDKTITFTPTKNTLNPASHGDMSMACWLSPEIDAEDLPDAMPPHPLSNRSDDGFLSQVSRSISRRFRGLAG